MCTNEQKPAADSLNSLVSFLQNQFVVYYESKKSILMALDYPNISDDRVNISFNDALALLSEYPEYSLPRVAEIYFFKLLKETISSNNITESSDDKDFTNADVVQKVVSELEELSPKVEPIEVLVEGAIDEEEYLLATIPAHIGEVFSPIEENILKNLSDEQLQFMINTFSSGSALYRDYGNRSWLKDLVAADIVILATNDLLGDLLYINPFAFEFLIRKIPYYNGIELKDVRFAVTSFRTKQKQELPYVEAVKTFVDSIVDITEINSVIMPVQ